MLAKITDSDCFIASDERKKTTSASKEVDLTRIAVRECGFTDFLEVYGKLIEQNFNCFSRNTTNRLFTWLMPGLYTTAPSTGFRANPCSCFVRWDTQVEALNAKNILRKASMQVRNDSMRLCKRALHPCKDLNRPCNDLLHPCFDLKYPCNRLLHPCSDLMHRCKDLNHPCNNLLHLCKNLLRLCIGLKCPCIELMYPCNRTLRLCFFLIDPTVLRNDGSRQRE